MSIIFAIRDRYGFLNGSEVSEQLRNLSVVEFSFYLGFPVQQIAEREYLWPRLQNTFLSIFSSLQFKNIFRYLTCIMNSVKQICTSLLAWCVSMLQQLIAVVIILSFCLLS